MQQQGWVRQDVSLAVRLAILVSIAVALVGLVLFVCLLNAVTAAQNVRQLELRVLVVVVVLA